MKKILDWLKQILSEKQAMEESYCMIDERQIPHMPQRQTTKLK